MRFTKPQYFYHITTKCWEDEVLLHPLKYYELPCSSNRDEAEPDVAKICVSKTVAGCMSALHLYSEDVNVYRTREMVRAAYCWRVCDVAVTQERWVTESTWFKKILTIPYDKMRELTDKLRNCNPWPGDPSHIKSQWKARGIIEKFLSANYPWLPESKAHLLLTRLKNSGRMQCK